MILVGWIPDRHLFHGIRLHRCHRGPPLVLSTARKASLAKGLGHQCPLLGRGGTRGQVRAQGPLLRLGPGLRKGVLRDLS